MKVIKHITTITAVSTLALSLSGVAFADTVSTTTTGPDSTNNVSINNTSSDTTSNTNTIDVTNVNLQVATTGDVTASDNTNVGAGLSSGNAVNNDTQTTAVSVGNTATPVGGSGGSQGGVVGGSGNGGTTTAGTGGSGNGGSVLGASIGGMGSGVATLPEVGAKFPVDVSALRALYHPAAPAATTQLAKQSNGISAAFLALAAFLSLVGAAGSAMFSRRQRQA